MFRFMTLMFVVVMVQVMSIPQFLHAAHFLVYASWDGAIPRRATRTRRSRRKGRQRNSATRSRSCPSEIHGSWNRRGRKVIMQSVFRNHRIEYSSPLTMVYGGAIR